MTIDTSPDALSLTAENIAAILRKRLTVKRHTGVMPGPYIDGVPEAAQALLEVIQMARQTWRLDELQHWRSRKELHFELCDHAHAQFGTLDEQFRAARRIYEEATERYGDKGPLFQDMSHVFSEAADAAN